MEVEETNVILAFSCNWAMVIEPQLHMVDLIFPKVSSRLSFILPA